MNLTDIVAVCNQFVGMSPAARDVLKQYLEGGDMSGVSDATKAEVADWMSAAHEKMSWAFDDDDSWLDHASKLGAQASKPSGPATMSGNESRRKLSTPLAARLIESMQPLMPKTPAEKRAQRLGKRNENYNEVEIDGQWVPKAQADQQLRGYQLSYQISHADGGKPQPYLMGQDPQRQPASFKVR